MDGSGSVELTAALAGIGVPDRVETPLGAFEFFDGVPLPESTRKLYDGLDFVRGIDAFLNAVPGASLVAMRRGFRSIGIDGLNVLGVTDPRANSGSYFLTPNTSTAYGTMFIDLHDGPVVIEPPTNSLCVVDDFWFRYVTDMGIAGPDKGQGGKYLFLPPGYTGDEPEGYFVCRTPTFTNWVVFRALDGIEAVKQSRVYRLSESANPPEMTFVNIADEVFNTVHSNDISFFGEVDELIQEEPPGSLDPERAGQLAGIGIKHGRPFEPDDRLKKILDSAAKTAAGISRALAYFPRGTENFTFEGASWKDGFVGGSYEFLHEHARLLDARTLFHYVATVITPAMAHAQVGAGSAYTYTAEDSQGRLLDGAKTYRLVLPPNPPAKNFWSVDVYDTQTRSLLQTDNPHPSVMSLSGTVQEENDGSIVLWFGPTAPAGKEANWIRTVPGKSWWPILRLYGPLQPWFDKAWQPGEIEEAS
ncbi:hypothetical protein ABIC28_002313 [Rhodococcus sp. PvR044]|jgi:hypothetical protein|uniref:DUF1254 domain-containing protein n=1 Tax=unclassified Rhodococcus (in: high G+C Gram-positive bacteria) TaxID=192944 RepID=UPI000BD119E1|nr:MULTISPECIES: DUF1254 domain-containing protein [unclassified Rhodococcus (in: high G+C Gram-positive bacteria)]MBP1160211.1 hypothetical protein [Rhodococcus sp. PvR099]PTR42796.1 hypothetical protein C8K38_11093 [Rhodococcus sp. OK611]SNX91847.1 Uncharacterized conserved protein [Rhodococcus sp. OK270]